MKICILGNIFRWTCSSLGSDVINECIKQVFSNDEVFIQADLDYAKVRNTIFQKSVFSFEKWYMYQDENYKVTDRLLDINDFACDLIVGYEIPPSLCKFFTKNNLVYINFFTHPVRFLPDLLWAVTTNSKELFYILDKYSFQIKPQDSINRIKFQTLKDRNRFEYELMKNTAVIFGQTPYDASVLDDGKFKNLYDFRHEIKQLVSNSNDVLIVPHPLLSDYAPIFALIEYLGKGKICNFNSYSLLSSSKVSKVITLSSSLGVEAKYFGKESHMLLGEALREGGGLRESGSYITSISASILSREMWYGIASVACYKFNGVHHRNSLDYDCTGQGFVEPNFFRRIFGGWGMDTFFKPLEIIGNISELTGYISNGIRGIDILEFRKIVFSDSYMGKFYYSEGLSDFEADGRWSDGEMVVLKFYRMPKTKSVKLTVKPYIGGIFSEQIINIKVNGVEYKTCSLSSPLKHNIFFNLPQYSYEISMTIKFPMLSEVECVNENDNRILGIKFVALEQLEIDYEICEKQLKVDVQDDLVEDMEHRANRKIDIIEKFRLLKNAFRH